MRYSLFTVVLASIAVLTVTGCPKPPSFQGGIRCIAYENLAGTGVTIGVPNVLDYGNASGSGNGGLTSFEGATGAFGIDDHVSAATGTTWLVTFNFAVAIPDCGMGSAGGFVPSQGAEFAATCFL